MFMFTIGFEGLEGVVGKPVRVQIPPSAPAFIPHRKRKPGISELPLALVLPRGSASQALGDEGDDQGIQAHALLHGLGGKLGVKAFRDPLNPFPT
jgi:hypothetical protein